MSGDANETDQSSIKATTVKIVIPILAGTGAFVALIALVVLIRKRRATQAQSVMIEEMITQNNIRPPSVRTNNFVNISKISTDRNDAPTVMDVMSSPRESTPIDCFTEHVSSKTMAINPDEITNKVNFSNVSQVSN